MPSRKPKTKSIRKPVINKAALHAEIKRLNGEVQWGQRLVQVQQGEIDRLMKLNDSLTASINNISKWDK
jgi:hypothetical protein